MDVSPVLAFREQFVPIQRLALSVSGQSLPKGGQ
jgi:hypothetical protein